MAGLWRSQRGFLGSVKVLIPNSSETLEGSLKFWTQHFWGEAKLMMLMYIWNFEGFPENTSLIVLGWCHIPRDPITFSEW